MVVKESSDELNPPVITAAEVSLPQRRRSPKDYLALVIATCGVGYIPLAPGTLASLLAVGIYLELQFLTLSAIQVYAGTNSIMRFSPWSVLIAVELVLITLITLAGIWAASRAEALFGRKDPGKIVIDEVAGQLIALLPVLPRLDPGWLTILAAFVLFRLFDIIKPYPARRLESLESGLGIMADDIVAGAYAAVGTALIVVGRWYI